MARIHLEIVRQREEFGVDAVVELARVLSRTARKIGTTYGADEERVAGQDEPRIGAPSQIGHHEAHALRRVAWRIEYGDASVAELDLLPWFWSDAA